MSIKEQIKNLTEAERKIYDSIMRSFPATHPGTALDKAYQGGVRFNFIYK